MSDIKKIRDEYISKLNQDLDLNSINTSFKMPEHTQGWMLKLPNGKPWLYVSTSDGN